MAEEDAVKETTRVKYSLQGVSVEVSHPNPENKDSVLRVYLASATGGGMYISAKEVLPLQLCLVRAKILLNQQEAKKPVTETQG